MKQILLFAMFAACLTACEFHHIKGNGDLTTEEKKVGRADRIYIDGSFDVELTQGAAVSLKIEADDNLHELIEVEEHDGKLRIKQRNGVGFSTNNRMVIYITTPSLKEFHLSGSGTVTGKNKFTETDHLSLSVSGSGNVTIEVNTPDVDADIAGSGALNVKGETKDLSVNISGSGDYHGYDLKSENAKVAITGSGGARLFADSKLDVNIAGSGSVYYKGSAEVSKNVLGSGEVRKEE